LDDLGTAMKTVHTGTLSSVCEISISQSPKKLKQSASSIGHSAIERLPSEVVNFMCSSNASKHQHDLDDNLHNDKMAMLEHQANHTEFADKFTNYLEMKEAGLIKKDNPYPSINKLVSMVILKSNLFRKGVGSHGHGVPKKCDFTTMHGPSVNRGDIATEEDGLSEEEYEYTSVSVGQAEDDDDLDVHNGIAVDAPLTVAQVSQYEDFN